MIEIWYLSLIGIGFFSAMLFRFVFNIICVIDGHEKLEERVKKLEEKCG